MLPINILQIDHDDPDLEHSRLLDAMSKTMDFAREHGGIGLTQSKAFNRKFCTWAAENFGWQEYSADELLKIQKVLNEPDVVPVMVLHDLFVSMRLGRHIKGKFQFSKKAYELAEDRGALFGAIANHYLFEFDHSNFQRRPFRAPGNWDIFLNVTNVEAHGGATEARLLDVFYGYGPNETGAEGYWHHASFLHWHVLTPLYWLGFLDKMEIGDSFLDRENFYVKTPLWRKCLRLDTDKGLEPILVH